MQNRYRFLSLLVLPLLFTLPSCNEDLLTEDPTNFLSPVNFFRNSSDAEIALNGLYAGQQRLQGYAGGDAGVAAIWGMHGTDEIVVPPWTPPQRRTLFLYSYTPSLSVFFDNYARHYEEINRANTVINQVTKMSEDQIDEEDRTRIIGESRALRGSFYFNLVRMFNRVPLVTEERENLDNLAFVQEEPEVIYGQVIEDLTAAINSLEAFGQSGRVSKTAAQALLGKVYLQMAGEPLNQSDKYVLAAEQFEAVMNSGLYVLQDDFQQVFDLDNELNEELVWVVEHDAPGQNIDGSQNSNLGSFMGPHGPLEEGGGWGTAWSATDLENAYDRHDTRRRVTIAYGNAPNVLDSVRGPNQFKPWKWQKPAGQAWGNDTPFDYAYIRYAEVLLGFAEAHSQANGTVTTEALEAINRVRARARAGGNPETVVPDIEAGISIDELIDVLDNERYLELAFEGHRKGDLVRWGRLVDRMNGLQPQTAVWPGPPDCQEYETLWPIPQQVLDLNSAITQNPGY